jgi:hypothetical protein
VPLGAGDDVALGALPRLGHTDLRSPRRIRSDDLATRFARAHSAGAPPTSSVRSRSSAARGGRAAGGADRGASRNPTAPVHSRIDPALIIAGRASALRSARSRRSRARGSRRRVERRLRSASATRSRWRRGTAWVPSAREPDDARPQSSER